VLLDGEVSNETQQREHNEVVVDPKLANSLPSRPHAQSDKRKGGYRTDIPRHLRHCQALNSGADGCS
jgi:hypothetical protein